MAGWMDAHQTGLAGQVGGWYVPICPVQLLSVIICLFLNFMYVCMYLEGDS